MDKLDWKIVAALERDGRQSYADLGEQVGLSKSPCWSRVKNLEESGVIEGYAARLDPIAIGLAVQSFVEVQIRFDAHIEFEAAVLAHPAVVECHTTAGESDYLLKIFARPADHGRTSVVEGQSVTVRVGIGGGRSIKKKRQTCLNG